MRRREFIAGLGGAAAWPLAAWGQQRPLPVVGFLNLRSADDSKYAVVAFLQGLKEAGFVDGQNVAIEYRFAENQVDRLAELAADLVRRRVAVIAAGALPAIQAVKNATTTIPITFTTVVDPVASGLVASLNRPGANLTGVTVLSIELAPKHLQLLRELIPQTTRAGVLTNPAEPQNQVAKDGLRSAARAMGLQLVFVGAQNDDEIEAAFATFEREQVGAVLIGNDTFYNRRLEKLAMLAKRHALPSLYWSREYAVAGGLMSYGSSAAYAYRQLGVYSGRILNGAEPTDLPVEQATRIELTLNLKTANALGLTVPQSILLRADQVIE
jgi:putative tryptophan/tyrosine transport system substrate-binding protein